MGLKTAKTAHFPAALRLIFGWAFPLSSLRSGSGSSGLDQHHSCSFHGIGVTPLNELDPQSDRSGYVQLFWIEQASREARPVSLTCHGAEGAPGNQLIEKSGDLFIADLDDWKSIRSFMRGHSDGEEGRLGLSFLGLFPKHLC